MGVVLAGRLEVVMWVNEWGNEFIEDLEDDDESAYCFDVDSDGVLVDYDGSGGEVFPPDGISAVGDFAFVESGSLVRVDLSRTGVRRLGEGAFSCCERLSEVVLPDCLVEVGRGAFEDCEVLSGLVLPQSVMSVGESAFVGTRLSPLDFAGLFAAREDLRSGLAGAFGRSPDWFVGFVADRFDELGGRVPADELGSLSAFYRGR
jgi:hypothetical protein